jgi:hypothetical protein
MIAIHSRLRNAEQMGRLAHCPSSPAQVPTALFNPSKSSSRLAIDVRMVKTVLRDQSNNGQGVSGSQSCVRLHCGLSIASKCGYRRVVSLNTKLHHPSFTVLTLSICSSVFFCLFASLGPLRSSSVSSNNLKLVVSYWILVQHVADEEEYVKRPTESMATAAQR